MEEIGDIGLGNLEELNVQYSEELEVALKEVFKSTDPIDNPSLDIISYLNEKFPNAESLDNVDIVLHEINEEIKGIDKEIHVNIIEQSSMQEEMKEHMTSIGSEVTKLTTRITGIKEKAEVSEKLVKAICSDIKSLDHAKKNLTFTISSLKKLMMLVTGIEQLREFCIDKNYKDIANLVEATNDLFSSFDEYKDLPHIKELREERDTLFHKLRMQIMTEFENINVDRPLPPEMGDACLAINTLGPRAVDDMKEWFCNYVLNDYKSEFAIGRESSAFENISRRFGWLKRILEDYKYKFAHCFPPKWILPITISQQFCKITRGHLDEILATNHRIIDVAMLIRVLQKSLEFEKELYTKFIYEQKHNQEYSLDSNQVAMIEGQLVIEDVGTVEEIRRKHMDKRGVESDNLEIGQPIHRYTHQPIPDDYKIPKFDGIISQVFAPYLVHYAKDEEKKLLENLEKIVIEDKNETEDGVFTHSLRLFSNIKSSLNRCLSFSKGDSLLNLSTSFKNVLGAYADALRLNIPKFQSQEKAKLSEGEEKGMVFVINTSNYCLETIRGMQRTIEKHIDEPYKEKVNLFAAEEYFNEVINECILLLISSIENKMEVHYDTMLKIKWSTIEVGDTSAYAKRIGEVFRCSVDNIHEFLTPTYYFYFINKIVGMVTDGFLSHVYRCRKLNEHASPQMMLDLDELKKKLLSLMSIGEGELAGGSSQSYMTYVSRAIGKIETRIKILGYPITDITNAYQALIKDPSAEDYEKILIVKGVKKSDLHNYKLEIANK